MCMSSRLALGAINFLIIFPLTVFPAVFAGYLPQVFAEQGIQNEIVDAELKVNIAPNRIQSISEKVIYTLGSGDKIKVTVFGHKDLSGGFFVDGTSAISLPLIGEVSASGLTLRELERAITAKLKDGYLINPRVSVEVLSFRPFYILGEVKKPGSYEFVSGMTVLNAVAMAGGYTKRGKKDKIFIIRATDKEHNKQDATPETVVLPGDIIEVPERFF